MNDTAIDRAPPADDHGVGSPRGTDSRATAFDPLLALPLGWYERSVEDVAVELLGCVVVSQRPEGLAAGVIVETEAYGGTDDPASHAAFRQNGVVRAMFGPPGSAYVYVAYGMYACLNIVTGPHGRPSAVLLRALEPVCGQNLMAQRQGKPPGPRIASGPGLLGRALGVSLADNEHPLCQPPLWIQPGHHPETIAIGPRVGITRGLDRLWRFGIQSHPALSRPFPRQPANET